MIKINKKIIFIVILVPILVIGFVAWRSSQKEKYTNVREQSFSSQHVEDKSKNSKTIRLIATGDFIAHDSVNINAKSGSSYDYLKMMSKMEPFFSKADLRFCNQATPAGGTQFGITGYPVFNAPLEFTKDMVKLGCNVVNIGTNHTYDKGQDLINAMVDEWDRQHVLAFAGANRTNTEKEAVKYFQAKGVKFAFLSYSTYSNSPVSNGFGVTMYSKELAQTQITEAKSKADIVLVSMRWGTEYSPEVNAQQSTVSQDLADMGADIILGHGPHVLEPVKILRGAKGNETITWYSLGNFLNTQLDIESLTGAIAIMDIDVNTKRIVQTSALPIYMHYEWTKEQKAAEDLQARHNLTMYPLDQAADALAKSQNSTTVEQQTNRISDVLNRYMQVKIYKSSEY